jgi:hypothetical protein
MSRRFMSGISILCTFGTSTIQSEGLICMTVLDAKICKILIPDWDPGERKLVCV